MKLNHLNLIVSDVSATCDFLQKHFVLRSLAGAPDNENIVILSDDNCMVLTLTRGSQLEEIKYSASFHIGFIQDSDEKVNEINQGLKENGFHDKPPHHFHGAWTFYLRAPGSFLIEVLH